MTSGGEKRLTEYVRKKSGIDKTLYRKVKYILADYDRMKRDKMDILYGSSAPSDGMPKGTGIGRPTERKAERLAVLESDLYAIDQACVAVRGAYSGKVYDDFDPIKAYWNYDYFNYMHIRTEKSPEGPVRRTWHRYKDSFTKIVAEKMKFI